MRMSVKPKGIVGIIFLIACIAVGAAVALSSGMAHSRSATRIGYVGTGGRSSWSGSYISLDGKMRKTLHFSEYTDVTVETKTESGVLAIEFKDEQNNIVFSNNDMGTVLYTVGVEGDIIVTISADKHSGSFSIK